MTPEAQYDDTLFGTWKPSAVHDKLYFHHPKDQLTFVETLRIDNGTAALEQITSNETNNRTYDVEIADVPVLKEEHTDTVMVLEKTNGRKLPVWLLKDGSLYMRFPANVCYYHPPIIFLLLPCSGLLTGESVFAREYEWLRISGRIPEHTFPAGRH